MTNLLHKWHWFWFKWHTKWFNKEWREQVYKELDKAISEIIKDVPIQYTEDVVIDLVNHVEHNDFISGNKYGWTKFENGVIKIADNYNS